MAANKKEMAKHPGSDFFSFTDLKVRLIGSFWFAR
jgi:hypothetical protein